VNTITEQQPEQQERPEFHIDSEERACWLLRKLANLDAERTRVRAQAAAIVAQLDSEEKSLRDRFEAETCAWARAELERRHKGRRKSLVLLQGTFAFRTVPATLRVDDLAAALNTAVTVGAVKVDTAAYRAAALNAQRTTGELLPGVVIAPEHETFAVRFGKDSSSDTDTSAGKEAGE
jgi:phage host-nuclease inhibitor protein Gam